MAIIFKQAKNISFFKIARDLGSPTPLRRVLSLMRILDCEVIAFEQYEFNKNCPENDCRERSISCRDYDGKLVLYDFKLSKKICNKLYFFKTNIKKSADLESLKNKDLLGYCIVHQDKLQKISDPDSIINKSYLTECVLNSLPENKLPRRLKGFSFGNIETKIKIEKKPFKLKGNYFCQQNATTNCCAQAAIKMSLRGYAPKLTSEKISKYAEIRHDKQEGYLGLRPEQIKKAIEDIPKLDLRTLCLKADDVGSSSDFYKAIAHAVACKVPTILLFNLPIKPFEKEVRGHAVSLIGYTNNIHKWGAYGGQYFSQSKNGYISSTAWCENFIIQDDNVGPFYHLPRRFLTDYIEFTRSLHAFNDNMMVKNPLSTKNWYDNSMSVIFAYPKSFFYIQDLLLVEPAAVTILNRYVQINSVEKRLPDSEDFNIFFYDNFKVNIEKKYSGAIITRTLLVRKNEYLKRPIINLYERNRIYELIQNILPEYFWIVEISIPELYWTNRAKVGEIIFDPILFNRYPDNPQQSLILLRLPNILTIYKFSEEKAWDKYLDQRLAYHSLIKKAKGLARL